MRWDVDFFLTTNYYSGSEDITLVGSTNPNDNDLWHNGYDFLRYIGQTLVGDE